MRWLKESMDKFNKINKPTTKITGSIQRVDAREAGSSKAIREDKDGFIAREMSRATLKYPISAAMKNMTHFLEERADGEVMQTKAPIPKDPDIMSRHLKRLGYFLRADLMGISKIPEYAVYTYDSKGNKIDLNHQYAIVIVIDQDYETMCGSTGYDWISGSQSYLAYSTSAFISSIMAEYIRKLGYSAKAQHTGTYQVAISPLLLWAGLGEMSRMGASVLNPFLGTRFKAAAVTTDLPLTPDTPIDFGLQEFCRVCKKCAIECPSQAIPMGDKIQYNGYETWRHDEERCTKFRFTHPYGSSCGRCIKVCPWNKPRGKLHDLVRWTVRNMPRMNRIMVKMDDVFGYGRVDIRRKWWFDMEEVAGVLVPPRKTEKNPPK